MKIVASYADKNSRLANTLLSELEDHFKAARGETHTVWSFEKLPLGEDFDQEIKRQMDEADAGLLLISPQFLARDYIRDIEIPRFLPDPTKAIPPASKKVLLPVILKPVDFQHHNLRGLEARQCFLLRNPNFLASKAYSDCDQKQRDAFAYELFLQIQRRLGDGK